MRNTLAGSFEHIETTLGELIEAITQIALESGKTTEEGYQLASLTLTQILKSRSEEIESLSQF